MSPNKDKDWTKRKFEWLIAVATDKSMRGLPCGIAVLFACRYFNMQTGDAWPSTHTLACELDADRRSVQDALQRLVQAGYLSCIRGGNGARDTNRYRLQESMRCGLEGALAGIKEWLAQQPEEEIEG